MNGAALDVALVADRRALHVPSTRANLAWALLFVVVPATGWLAQLAGAGDWIGMSTIAATVVLMLVVWPIDRYLYERRIERSLAGRFNTAPDAARLTQTEDARSGRAELLVFAGITDGDLHLRMERRRLGRYFVYHLAVTRAGETVHHAIGGGGVGAIVRILDEIRSDR